MAKLTTKQKRALQCTALVAFGAMALACSSQEKEDLKEGFRIGWDAATSEVNVDCLQDSAYTVTTTNPNFTD